MLKANLDTLISRILFVKPQLAPRDRNLEIAENTFRLSIVYSAVRCILQYVILPFVLPIVGLGAGASTTLSLIISVVAIVAILLTLRRFWQVDYSYKWQYLGVAVVALCFLAAFIYLDLQELS